MRAGLSAAIAVTLVLAWYAVRLCPGKEKVAHTRKPLPSAEEIAKLPPDGGPEFNRLIHEKSPYLLQHARNPVNWYPWGPEALAKAKKEGKPIFLSVGYSTCHWCHVMERESFEREDVAKILNEHYVAIKVDREERPDLDQIYMLATQLTSGRGGWPNSLWLTPDGRPWFTGTYFPREDRAGRAGFKTILTSLAKTWRTRQKEVQARADQIAKSMKRYSAGNHIAASGKLSRKLLARAVRAVGQSVDARQGGPGGPNFPPHTALRLLFDEYRRTKDSAVLYTATRTLDAMARGGIHDHVGGGFHRYSTDGRWFLPHFEKMLYDNAQLSRAYVDGYLLTGDERYKRVAVGIYEWVLREMADKDGGFHCALDADSEGEEGKFYLWSKKESLEILGEAEAKVFWTVYGAVDGGNFRDEGTGHKPGTNVLYLPRPIADAAAAMKIPPAELVKRLADDRKKLLDRRVRRVWPSLDDKVLTSWNALMIASLAYGGHQLKEPRYVAAATRAADFVVRRMLKDGRLLRTYRHGSAKLKAYLDDYAFLADGLLELHEATKQKRWLAEARSLADYMLEHYGDPAGGFFFTANDHEDLLARTKDPVDRAIPAGNAVAAHVLVVLSRHTGEKKYLAAAKKTLDTFGGFIERMPTGTAGMMLAAGEYLDAAEAGPTRAARPRPDAAAEAGPVALAAFASRLRAAPGQTIDLAVRITIDRGWHVNSHKPLQKNLIATRLALKAGPPVALSDVAYPAGKEVKFAFSTEAVSVYEGTAWIRGKVTIARTAKPGPAPLELWVDTQACNDSTCAAPQKHKLTLKVTIDAKAESAPPRHPSIFKR